MTAFDPGHPRYNPDGWPLEHPEHTLDDWQAEVINDVTRQGYEDWLACQLEEDTVDKDHETENELVRYWLDHPDYEADLIAQHRNGHGWCVEVGSKDGRDLEEFYFSSGTRAEVAVDRGLKAHEDRK